VSTSSTLAIVGGSLAGAKAAEGARQAGFDGRIVLVGDDTMPPYERPPLSKAVLRGEAHPTSTHVHADGFYQDHRIDLVAARATRVDPSARRVQLADGATIAFDALVLATGARPRRLEVPGAGLAGVHYLRTIDDALALRQAITAASRVAVVGAGWIGSEVAASARQMGAPVVLIDPAPTPLHRLLGDRLGTAFRNLHADHGVDLRLGARVAELRGRSGAVDTVVLADGRAEPADVVVVGVGVTPRTELADMAGITVHDGITVDERGETSVPGVFAAGDVANAWHPRYRRRLRVEHWANALNQGLTAGRNAAGRHEPYTRLPYFFSDQYDLGLEYVGHHAPGDPVVVRGDLASGQFIAFWQHDGAVTAAMNVNVWDVVDHLKALIESRAMVEPAALADTDAALAELSASAV
jgi:3-phenylpropionate/trans-cinnamate dioxygenase ferredoxin reductase component